MDNGLNKQSENDYNALNQNTQINKEVEKTLCPNCGYCPTCGRSRQPNYSAYPYIDPAQCSTQIRRSVVGETINNLY